MPYTTHVDEIAINSYVNSVDQPVQTDLRHRAERVLTAARAMAPVRTGRLRASLKIVHEPGIGGNMQYRVVADAPYALMVHEGTRPHLIHPRLRRTLRFKEGGRTVYATVVMHPGTRPHHYLTDALNTQGIG